MRSRWLSAIVLVLTGCQDNITTQFPPGLEPLDDNDQLTTLVTDGSEQFVTRGVDTDMIRVYGRGHIHAPLEAVWGAAHIPNTLLAKCNTTMRTVTLDNDPAYEYSFLVHYFVDDIVDVEWDDQWRGATIEPGLIMLKHQKVFGSDFITTSRGTVALVATTDPSVTEIQMVEHLDSRGGSVGDVRTSLTHVYNELRSVVHQTPSVPCGMVR